MCMSIGEHPKNGDLRVHRQPSEETKNAQKEDNEKFETYVGVQLSLFDQINNSIEQTISPKNEETNNENSETKETPTNNTPVETQQTEQNNINKPQEDNGQKPENEQQQKEETKTDENSEQKSDGKQEEKPSFRENISDAAKSFAGKISGFFSTAVDKIKEVSHNLQPEVREYNKLENEKERLVAQSQRVGIMLPEKLTQTQPGTTASELSRNIETIKSMIYNNRLDAWNRIEEFKHGQDIVDRVYEIRSDPTFHAGGFDAVQSPAEIFARQTVDRIPNSEVREELNKFYEFEKMYETIYSFVDNTSISTEDTRDIERTYIAEILDEGKSFSDIYLDLSADLRKLAENTSPSII